MCFRQRGRIWYAAGYGVIWFWFMFRFRCRVLGEYVLLDQADVFSSPVVSLAMGLNVVPLHSRSFISFGARDVS